MSYLTRTGVSSTNGGQHNTISFWFKRSNDLGNTADYIFGAEVDGNNYTWVRTENQRLEYISATGGIVKFKLSTSALFRDPTAWYHVVLRSSTTSGTSSNRIRMYVNGSQVTDFNTATYPDQNYFSYLCDNNTNMYVGRSSNPFQGNIADVNLLDGEDQAASKFGETDSTTGIWKPKADFTGINYGNNGFRLQFETSGNMGLDTSGEGHNFTNSSVSAQAQSTDTPSNNFATYNPLAKDGTPADNHDYTLGNTVVQNSSANWFTAFGSLGIPSSGKWYYEYTTSGSGTIDQLIGFAKSNFDRGSDAGADTTGCYTLYAASNGNGLLFTNSASSVNKGTSYCWTHGDTMMVAIDSSTRKIWYGKNGTWLSGGNPATGTTEDQTVTADDMAYGLLPVVSGYHTGSLQKINFGNPAYTISSGNADGAGFGNFEYAVPSGYYALCTKNINTYG